MHLVGKSRYPPSLDTELRRNCGHRYDCLSCCRVFFCLRIDLNSDCSCFKFRSWFPVRRGHGHPSPRRSCSSWWYGYCCSLRGEGCTSFFSKLDVAIAVYNGPESDVVSGEMKAIEKLVSGQSGWKFGVTKLVVDQGGFSIVVN